MATYAEEVLADSPTGFWRLGEASGTVAVDSSGNGHDGVYVGSPTLGVATTLGDGDTGVTLDGATQWVDITGLPSPGNTFTIEMIADFVDLSGYPVIAGFEKAAGGGDTDYMQVVADPYPINFVVRGSNPVIVSKVSAANLVAGSGPHHFALVNDGTSLTLYIDGVADSVVGDTTGQTPDATNGHLRFGRGAAGGTPVHGTIDECAYYNTALSAARIAAHFAAITNAPAAGGAPKWRRVGRLWAPGLQVRTDRYGR